MGAVVVGSVEDRVAREFVAWFEGRFGGPLSAPAPSPYRIEKRTVGPLNRSELEEVYFKIVDLVQTHLTERRV